MPRYYFKNFIFRFGKELKMHIRSLLKIVVANIWSLPTTAATLVKESIDFIKLVAVYQLFTDDLEKNLEKSLIIMTGKYIL